MPVNYLDSADYVTFGSPAALDDIGGGAFTGMSWLNLASTGHAAGGLGVIMEKYDPAAGADGWTFNMDTGAPYSDSLLFAYVWDGGGGLWEAPDVITYSSWIHVAFTYDNGNTGNNPLMYVGGVSKTVNELTAPVGNATSDAARNLTIGGDISGLFGIDGQSADPRLYASVLSAGDIADIANQKSYHLSAPLPYFRPKFLGAAGIQDFNGTALAGANTLVDDISGLLGTPAGSPTGADDTYLAY